MVNQTLGYSLWADFIERDFLEGTFKSWIDQGVINGATSNPAIFKQAFTTSKAYENQKQELQGQSAKEIYEALAISDIQRAADLLRPLFDVGNDGFVSIEVDPVLCDDTQGTIDEGLRLWKAINRPNVMIKVPSTDAGYEAMTALMAEGIAVNATLVFSMEQARRVAEAFVKAGCKAQGVISVFVSRFDRKVDSLLPTHLKGKLGVANAAAIYAMIEAYNTPSIRTLFASTGVKGESLPASYYMTELYGAHCVNTAPIETIEAFLRVKSPAVSLPVETNLLEGILTQIDSSMNRDDICQELMTEGLDAFKVAFKELLTSFEK